MAYEFAVSLSDQVSAGAKSSGDAVAELSAKMRLAQDDVAGMAPAMKASQTGMQAFASGAVRVGLTLQMVVGQIRGLASSLASGDFSGAIDKMTSAVAGAAKMLDAAIPGLGSALGAIIPIVGGIVSWAVHGVQSLMGMAIAASEGRERTLAFYDALADGHATGEQVAGMIGRLADKIGWTTDMLKPFARELMAMGHRDLPDLRAELVAVASAQALIGEGAGEGYLALARKIEVAREGSGRLKLSSRSLGKDLAAVGLSLNDVARSMAMSGAKLEEGLKAGTIEATKFGDAIRDAVTAKGKGPLEAFAHSLEGIGNRFKNMVKKLFAGADVKPFLRALEDVVTGFGAIMGVSKQSGSVMNGMFVFAGKAVKWLSLAFLDVIIWIGNAIDTVIDFFGETGAGGPIVDAISASFKAMATAIEMVVGPMKAVVDLFGKIPDLADLPSLLSGETGTEDMQSYIQTQIDGAKAIAKAREDAAFVGPRQVLGGPETTTMSIMGGEAGKAMSDGVAKGIAAGEIGVAAAAAKMGDVGVSALNNKLQRHSPSRVTMAIGADVSEGYELGVRGGIPGVARAMTDVGEVIAPIRDLSRVTTEPSENDNGRSAADDRDDRRSGDVTIYVQIDGAGKDAQEITEEMIATTFERIQLAQGA